MSTSISVSNYVFQGQVLSPAFSPPPSPESDDGSGGGGGGDDDDSLEAGKQGESGRKRKMSPPPSPSPPRQHRFVNKKPKFQTKYHAALQPLSPCTTLSVRTSRPAVAPSATRVINVQRQEEFHKLMRGCDTDRIETFLRAHSENIDINKFGEAGETALHSACQEGNVSCAKVLLKFGANPRLATRSGFSLLHLAAFAGSPELLALVTEVRKSY